MANNVTSDVHNSETMYPEYKIVTVPIKKSKGKYKQIAEA